MFFLFKNLTIFRAFCGLLTGENSLVGTFTIAFLFKKN